MRSRVEVCAVLFFVVAAIGCGSDVSLRDDDGGRGDASGSELDAFVVLEDAASPEDAGDPLPPGLDAGSITEIDAGSVPMGVDAGAGALDAGTMVPPPPVDAGPVRDPAFEVEMTYTTANIGRNYDTRAQMAAAIDRLGDVIGPRSGPSFVGWQEIGESDPCGGTCEIEAIRARFREDANWVTRHPRGTRPDGNTERVKVPISSRRANTDVRVRAVFASPGWAGVSPTRFVTVAYHPNRNVSVVNTHLIAGAWSCGSNVAQRRDYWRRGWNELQAQVAREHDRGRNVVVTGDLNRPRGANGCNPAWDPTSLHAAARIIGGRGIDYVFAVPAPGWRFAISRRADGSAIRGDVALGIDGHQAHWVVGRFLPR